MEFERLTENLWIMISLKQAGNNDKAICFPETRKAHLTSLQIMKIGLNIFEEIEFIDHSIDVPL